MWILSGFADEIAADVEEQLDVLAGEGMRYLELRKAWNKGVLTLNDDEIKVLKQTLKRRNVGVSSIGSPIGKIKITDPFEPHLEQFRRALWCAEELEAPYIRLFSFFVPDGEADAHRDEVMRRMSALAAEAEGTGVTLVHENEKHIYGDIPRRCLDIVQSVNSEVLKLAWDPANFVQCGVRPHTEGYEMLRPYIDYVHVKDALLENGKVTVAGKGDGEVRQTVRALRDSGFQGFFSMEPHLKSADEFSGFSGGELFVEAVRAFKGLVQEEGIALS